MALPWLESLPAFADTTAGAAFPKRFGVLFMGNGVNEDHWGAEGSGDGMTLSKTLAPLEPLKSKLNVVGNLENGSVFNSDGTSHVEPSHGRRVFNGPPSLPSRLSCPSCPLNAECQYAQEILGDQLATARTARTKPR